MEGVAMLLQSLKFNIMILFRGISPGPSGTYMMQSGPPPPLIIASNQHDCQISRDSTRRASRPWQPASRRVSGVLPF